MLAGCVSTPNPSGVEVVWNRIEEPHAVCESLSGRKSFFNVLGCAKRSETRCTIYAPRPRDERDLQRFATLGHELMHCFDGDWHDRWGRAK
jgi:hypothetical protein